MGESPIRMGRLLRAQAVARELSEEFGEEMPLGTASALAELRKDNAALERQVTRVDDTTTNIIIANILMAIALLVAVLVR